MSQTVTLNQFVNDMRGNNHDPDKPESFSLNELYERIAKAKEGGINVVMSKDEIESSNRAIESLYEGNNGDISLNPSFDYNNVNNDMNYYGGSNPYPYNMYNYNFKDLEEKTKHFQGIIQEYYAAQLGIAQYYRQEEINMGVGRYAYMSPEEFEQFRHGLLYQVQSEHIRHLHNLGAYLNYLEEDDLKLFQKLAVEYQLQLMYNRQYHKSSPQKKEYDMRLMMMEQQKKEFEDYMNNISTNSPAYAEIYNNYQMFLNNYMNERDNYNAYMYDCYKNNSGYGRQNYFENQAHTATPQQRSEMNRTMFENRAKAKALAQGDITKWTDYMPPKISDIKLNNPMIQALESNNNLLAKSTISLGSSQLANMIRPQALIDQGKTLDNRHGHFINSTDEQFNMMARGSKESPYYTPVFGGDINNEYSYNNNYLNPANRGNLSIYQTHNLNLPAQKNEFVLQMRRIGFVPQSFGYPYMNNDYEDQLIWATPVPDPRTDLDFAGHTPMWFLTPEALGYPNYVEYSRDDVNLIRNTDGFKVQIIKLSEMSDEEREAFYEEENRIKEEAQKAKEEARNREFKVTIITPEMRQTELEKQQAEEQRKLDELKTTAHYCEPRFNDDEYVKELESLNYVPEVVRNYMKNSLSKELLDTFTTDGLLFIHNYRVFIPLDMDEHVDNALRDRIAKLEEEVVNMRIQEEVEKRTENSNEIKDLIKNDLKIDEDLNCFDMDQMNRIKESAMNKLEGILNKNVPESLKGVHIFDDDDFYGNTYGANAPFYEVEVNNEDIDEVYVDPEEEVDELEGLFDDEFMFDDPDYNEESDNPILDYYNKLMDRGDYIIINGNKYIGGYDLGKATDEELARYYEKVGEELPVFSNGNTMKEAFKKLDVSDLENDITKLKQSIAVNLQADPFQGMTLFERINYLNNVINGGLYDKYDLSKLDPGVHKIYTDRGIFILDNRDFGVQHHINTNAMSVSKQSQYYIPPGSVSATDLVYNKLIIPTIKPEDKVIYKNTSDEYSNINSDYFSNIHLVKEKHEKDLISWKINNVYSLYNMSEERLNYYIQLHEMRKEYEDITGIPANYDGPITYAEWAAKAQPYLEKTIMRKTASPQIANIFNIVSEYQYDQGSRYQIHQIQKGDLASAANQVFGEYRSKAKPMRHFEQADFNVEKFLERKDVNCSYASKHKNYATPWMAKPDFVTKFPPIQFRGEANDLFM